MSPNVPQLLGIFGVDLPKQNRSIGKLPSLIFSDVLIIIGVGLGLLIVLSLAIYFWAHLRRKRRRHVSGGEKVYRAHEAQTAAEVVGSAESESDEHDEDEQSHHHGRRRYKFRVRRRTHRSRNPTLSETGGLPPVKTQEPGKPC